MGFPGKTTVSWGLCMKKAAPKEGAAEEMGLFADVIQRVFGLTVIQDLEVDMGTVGPAGVAHLGDDVALGHLVTHLTNSLLQWAYRVT